MIGETKILMWQDGKSAAVSITYDDGSPNQFRKAIPLMNQRDLAGTFFIITGEIAGSARKGRFVGRPIAEIIRECRVTPTSQENFFERASAIRFLEAAGGEDFHTRAGELFESGKAEQAYDVVDLACAKAQRGATGASGAEGGDVKKGAQTDHESDPVSWDAIRQFAAQGHEFASHTVTHPYLAVLDEPNLRYELEASRQEILEQLGPEHIFSIECPYGTEDPRAMSHAFDLYPITRNRLTDENVEEINRWSDADPTASTRTYVQWQRGVYTRTELTQMVEWLETAASRHNIWLVLVFHGIDDLGWEPVSSENLRIYFDHIDERGDRIWVATYQDVGKYIRERTAAEVNVRVDSTAVSVRLTHALERSVYTLPLTLETRIPSDWMSVELTQGLRVETLVPTRDADSAVVTYRMVPNTEDLVLHRR